MDAILAQPGYSGSFSAFVAPCPQMAQPDSLNGPAFEPLTRRVTARRRGKLFLAGIITLAATATGLYWVAAPDPERALFFDLWRTRHLLVAGASIWVAGLLTVAAVGRKAAFIWMTVSIMAICTLALLEVPGLLGVVDYPKIFGRSHDALGGRAIPHLDIKGHTSQDLASLLPTPPPPIPFHYRADQRGFRNPMDRDAADIYLLGDSVVVAGLVPIGETVSQRIEASLSRSTMTIALIAIGVQKERDLFVAADLPLKGRLVLHFVFEGNDLLDSNFYRTSRPKAEHDPGLLDGSLTNQLLLSLQASTSRKRTSRGAIGMIDDVPHAFAWLANSWRNLEDELAYIEQVILELRTRVERRGGHYALVFVPAKIRVLGDLCHWPENSPVVDYRTELNPMRASLSLWAKEMEIPLLDLTDSLRRSQAAGEHPWFTADTHPNGEGHRVMAEQILDWKTVKKWSNEHR